MVRWFPSHYIWNNGLPDHRLTVELTQVADKDVMNLFCLQVSWLCDQLAEGWTDVQELLSGNLIPVASTDETHVRFFMAIINLTNVVKKCSFLARIWGGIKRTDKDIFDPTGLVL